LAIPLSVGCGNEEKQDASTGVDGKEATGVTGTLTLNGTDRTALSGVVFHEMWDGVLVLAVVPWLGASCEPEDGTRWDWLGTRGDHAGELMISIFLDSVDEDGDGGEAWEVDEDGDFGIEDGLIVTLSDLSTTSPSVGDLVLGTASMTGGYRDTVEGEITFSVPYCGQE
jgi:hypothetical protein